MIDTIVLRLHDLNLHKDIYDLQCRPSFNTIHRKRKVLEFRNISDLPAEVVRDVIQYGDSGTEKTASLRGKFNIPSSHYNVNFAINEDKDFIEWNFSIPKYFYGNNIAQFVRPVSDKRFIMGVDYRFCEQQKYLFDRLSRAIDIFFDENFHGLFIDYTRLEINRVDLCFNQLFQDREEALRYLSYQKKLNLKNMRLNSARFHNYNTSIFYTGENYSVKIYHKGSEYHKTDAVEHTKINNILLKCFEQDNIKDKSYEDMERGFNSDGKVLSEKDIKQYYELIKGRKSKLKLIDIDFLQGEADKILRYEMTFRKSLMANVFKDKVFRSADREFKDAIHEFKQWWNVSKSGSNKSNIPKDFIKMFDYLLKFKRKVLTPWRSIEKGKNRRNFTGGVIGLNRVDDFKLDDDTLQAMVKVFRKFVCEFQVKNLDAEETFLNKLRKYNEEAERESVIWKDLKGTPMYRKAKIKKKKGILRMSMIFNLLLKFGSWDNIKSSGLLTESTYHRYKSEFRELGLDKNYISPEIFNAKIEYDDYYMLEMLHRDQLKFNY